ncbi:hypothetical protein BDV59DRAFT_78389 [Aspergillus ambiguus]|uniref:uncharacterized protein n=1 Tax=Aspergillus ambiguus TaxID=176160 RepID=UPI003CCD38C5
MCSDSVRSSIGTNGLLNSGNDLPMRFASLATRNVVLRYGEPRPARQRPGKSNKKKTNKKNYYYQRKETITRIDPHLSHLATLIRCRSDGEALTGSADCTSLPVSPLASLSLQHRDPSEIHLNPRQWIVVLSFSLQAVFTRGPKWESPHGSYSVRQTEGGQDTLRFGTAYSTV